jgi:hypothetical protein
VEQIKSVLSVHAEMVSKFTGCLFKWHNNFNASACYFRKHLLILNFVPEAASKNVPGFSSLPLVVSVFASVLLVDFLQSTYGTIASSLRKNFQDHRQLPAYILKVEIAVVGSLKRETEMNFRIDCCFTTKCHAKNII